jgi:hypothetical protein
MSPADILPETGGLRAEMKVFISTLIIKNNLSYPVNMRVFPGFFPF